MARPRNAVSKPRRTILKTATGGLAAVAAVVVTVTTAMQAAGWVLTIATRNRSESAARDRARRDIGPAGVDRTIRPHCESAGGRCGGVVAGRRAFL